MQRKLVMAAVTAWFVFSTLHTLIFWAMPEIRKLLQPTLQTAARVQPGPAGFVDAPAFVARHGLPGAMESSSHALVPPAGALAEAGGPSYTTGSPESETPTGDFVVPSACHGLAGTGTRRGEDCAAIFIHLVSRAVSNSAAASSQRKDATKWCEQAGCSHHVVRAAIWPATMPPPDAAAEMATAVTAVDEVIPVHPDHAREQMAAGQG